jgi:hypothetical protein
MTSHNTVEDFYQVVIKSSDNIATAGKNNTGTFVINWDDFLPRHYQRFKLNFTFATEGGYYMDTASTNVCTGYINMNFGGRSQSYETGKQGETFLLGQIYKQFSTFSTPSQIFKCFLQENPYKIIYRPNQNILTIDIYNQSTNTLLQTTNNAGAYSGDMTKWVLILNLIPIEDSYMSKTIKGFKQDDNSSY